MLKVILFPLRIQKRKKPYGQWTA